MSWIATERFEARTGPGGLGLVQELINTHATERGAVDLLADTGAAERWAQAAADEWARVQGLDAPELSLSPAGLRALRDLRETVRVMLENPAGPFQADGLVPRAPTQLVSDRQGRVVMIPLGTDAADWVASAVWAEILLAQRGDEWSRIKLCREAGCRTAFYDGSRNGSAIWHNVRTCGNAANLRASRARRRGPQA